MKRGRNPLEFDNLRPILCCGLALILLFGSFATPISYLPNFIKFAEAKKDDSDHGTSDGSGKSKKDDSDHDNNGAPDENCPTDERDHDGNCGLGDHKDTTAPTGLTATAGNAQISLSWTAPSNGGAAITAYKVYRSTSSGAETLLITLGNVLTYTNTGLTNGQTYFYKVSAVNSEGEGNKSNEASATPVAPATTPGAPTITILGDNPATVQVGSTYTDAGATATESVSVITSGTVDTSVVGTYTITYSATDAAGNTATATRTINVVDSSGSIDTVAPSITILGDNPATVQLSSTYTDAGATATDLVDGPVSVTTSGTVDTSVVGTYTITYSATDAAGNKATATRTINVVDSGNGNNAKDPCPDDQPRTGDNNGNCGHHEEELPTISVLQDPFIVSATGTKTPVDYSNNVSASDGATLVCLPASGSEFAIGDTLVTCTATKEDDDKSSEKTFTVSVVDDKVPVIGQLSGITVEASQLTGNATVEFKVTAIDNVDGDISGKVTCEATGVTLTNTAGTVSGDFPVGSKDVSCSATDAADNTSEPASFTVTVLAPEPPTIIVPQNDIIEVAPSGSNSVVVDYSNLVSFTDNLGVASSSCDPSSGSSFPLGKTTVTCTAKDAAGNEASESFTINVVAPSTNLEVFAPAPGTLVTVGALVDGLAAVTFEATAHDGDVTVLVTCTNSVPIISVDGRTFTSQFPPGETNVTCSATNNGNTVSTSFMITVASSDSLVNVVAIPSGGTAQLTTDSGTIWSLMQSSTESSTVTFTVVSGTSTTFATPVAGGTNQYTMAFMNEVLDVTPASSTICISGCTISIDFTQTDMDAQGLTLDIIRILHDANHDGIFDPTTESLDTKIFDKSGEGSGPFVASATVSGFSKFAIGGVKSVLFLAGLAGGGSGTLGPTVTQFSVNTAGAAGFAAILELDPNKPHTNVVDTFDPSTVTMRLAHPEGAAAVKHVGIYLNLAGMFSRQVTDSDTYIIWDRNQPLQVVDPHGFMKGVDLKPSIIGKNLQLKLSLTFVKPMSKSDVLVRTWDDDLNTRNIRYKDALQIVPPQTISPESNVPVFVKNNAAFWADGKITDNDFVQGIQYLIQQKIMIVPSVTGTSSGTTTPSVTGTTSPIISGTTTAPGIPAWVKNNAKWWSEDQISESDFLSGIQYLIAHGVINVQ